MDQTAKLKSAFKTEIRKTIKEIQEAKITALSNQILQNF